MTTPMCTSRPLTPKLRAVLFFCIKVPVSQLQDDTGVRCRSIHGAKNRKNHRPTVTYHILQIMQEVSAGIFLKSRFMHVSCTPRPYSPGIFRAFCMNINAVYGFHAGIYSVILPSSPAFPSGHRLQGPSFPVQPCRDRTPQRRKIRSEAPRHPAEA